MPVFDNMNLSTSPGLATSQVEQYYIRQLLEYMTPELVHGRDAQKVPLPEHNGRTVQFRKYTAFPAVTTPLSEGVTPAGQTLTQTAFTATIKPYGAHVEFTDETNVYLIDKVSDDTSRLLADQASLTLDTISRDAKNAGMNVQFPAAYTARAQITATDKLTFQDVKRAVRTLKRNNCKPFPDGYFHAIIHPDSIYDLTSDPYWVDKAKYQDKMAVEKYELGMIYGVRFFESTNAKVFKTEAFLYGAAANLAITNGSWSATTRTLKTATALTDADCRQLTGKFVNIKGSTGVLTPMCLEKVKTDGTITLRWNPGTAVTANWATGVTVERTGGGAANIDVYSTLIFGDNAFGEVSIAGGKNVQVFINAPGSSGALDPLHQRGTIAWKVPGFCAVILQDDFVVRVEHAASL